MCEKHLVQRYVLTALYRLPSHSFVFRFCFPSCNFFFYDGIYKGNHYSVCIDMIFAQYQKCSKYF